MSRRASTVPGGERRGPDVRPPDGAAAATDRRAPRPLDGRRRRGREGDGQTAGGSVSGRRRVRLVRRGGTRPLTQGTNDRPPRRFGGATARRYRSWAHGDP